MRKFTTIKQLFPLMLVMLALVGCHGEQDGVINESDADLARGSQEREDTKPISPENADIGTEDSSGEAEPEYPILTEVPSHRVDYVMESEGIYCVYADGKYGFLTEAGEVIKPFIYPEASPFSEGLACVCMDGKYGFIDKSGDTALEFIYDYATPFMEGLAYFAIGDSYGFMDRSGEPAFYLECDSVSSFKEGLAYFSVDGKYGYIDQTGTVVIEPVYDDADYFSQGKAKVRNGGSYGLIDVQGNEVLPAVYDQAWFSAGYLMAKLDERYLCFGPDGKGGWNLLLEGDSIYAWQCAERTFLEYDNDGKKCLADEYGNVLLTCDWIKPLEDTGYVLARMFGEEGTSESGIWDLQGNQIVPFGEYDFIYSYGDDASVGLLEVEKDGLRGFLALEDMTLRIPAVWEAVGSFSQGGRYTWVRRDDRYGIIDTEGSLIYPAEYEKVSVFENNSLALWKNGIATLYDDQGRPLCTAGKCRSISFLGECYRVSMKESVKYLGLDGKEVDIGYSDYTVEMQSNIQVAHSNDKNKNDIIVKTGDSVNPVAEIEDAILKNAITPKVGPLYRVFLGRMGGETGDEPGALSALGAEGGECTKPLFRLYLVEGCAEPLLYYYEEPYKNYWGFPFSTSSFYQVQEGLAVKIVDGYECGGSMRGDYATLWYEKETGQVFPGLSGNWGGFGGYSDSADIYKNLGKGFEEAASFYSTTMFSARYAPEDILETPELFYDADGRPFTAETVMKGEDDPDYCDEEVTYYTVGGAYVTEERYREEKARYEELISVW